LRYLVPLDGAAVPEVELELDVGVLEAELLVADGELVLELGEVEPLVLLFGPEVVLLVVVPLLPLPGVPLDEPLPEDPLAVPEPLDPPAVPLELLGSVTEPTPNRPPVDGLVESPEAGVVCELVPWAFPELSTFWAALSEPPASAPVIAVEFPDCFALRGCVWGVDAAAAAGLDAGAALAGTTTTCPLEVVTTCSWVTAVELATDDLAGLDAGAGRAGGV
jgi:hypothetical protein